jgi:hypothetical protein
MGARTRWSGARGTQRAKDSGGRWSAGSSAASLEDIAGGGECFAKQTLIVANTPLVWIAINIRDPTIFILPPCIFK